MNERTGNTDFAAGGPVAAVVGAGRERVELEASRLGDDLLVRITGGRAHVGAVAACDGRAVRDHAGPSGQVLVLGRHREGPLAAEAAETLAAALGCSCAAVVGIHQDAATPEEIHRIVANVRTGLARLVAALRDGEDAS